MRVRTKDLRSAIAKDRVLRNQILQMLDKQVGSYNYNLYPNINDFFTVSMKICFEVFCDSPIHI